jgi:hypothetical protein
MKMKHWMFTVLSSCLLVEMISAQAPPAAPQDAPPPVIPAGDVPPPAKPDKKSAAKKKQTPAKPKDTKGAKTEQPEKAAATLGAGPAVAKEKNVNVRGQAAINSEIVTHLKRGDLVTVLEEVNLKKAGTDEPARWAKIALPPGSVVWVNAHFINPDTKAVVPKRLNLRSGPGENYSILGRLDHGTVVKEVETKGDWLKIEAPTNSYAFVAAHLLSTDPADLGPALAKAHPPAPAVPPPTETAVVAPPPPPPPTAQPLPAPPAAPPPPVVPAPPPPTETAAVPPPSTEPPAVPALPVEEPPIKRVVTREGIVKGSASIQAPTYFVLRSLDNNKTINYLYNPATNVVMREYQFQRVIVTGEEVLDERWPNTPVINIDTIQTVP